MVNADQLPDDEFELQKLKKQVAERLKELRKKQGFTNYEDFAHRYDIPRAQYGRYEKGVDLRLSSLKKICAKAFNISLQEFFSEGFEEDSEN